MGYLVAMVIRVMLFVLVQFFILYTVQVKSMCVPILRSIGSELTEVRKYGNNCIFYLTSRDAKTVRRTSWRLDMGTSDRYFDKKHFETNQKSLRIPVQKLWLKYWFSCFQ